MNISVCRGPCRDNETPNEAHAEADQSALCLADKQVDKERSKRGQRFHPPPESTAGSCHLWAGRHRSAPSMMLRYLVLWLVLRRAEGKLKRCCYQVDPDCWDTCFSAGCDYTQESPLLV